jgi:hypothetical protein
MLQTAEVSALLARWWFNYDQGNFEVLDELLASDAHVVTRTDTGTTDYEEFVRSDLRGHDDVLAWQVQHRLDSPFPLRHMGVNVHVTGTDGDATTFSSYLFVTHVMSGAIANLSTAIVTGAVREEGGKLRLSALQVVLDTQTSVPMNQRS